MNAMQQVQVLVADDDETLLDMMARRLEKLGFEVDRAETGKAASVLLDRKGYDLVVTDIYMPEVTGLALLRLAKEKDAHIQVVVVTASATLETAIEALNAGAFAYLQKPFDHLSVFDNVISRAVEFRRLVLDNIRMAESQKRRGDLLEAEVTQRVQMTRKRQRELIDILACLPDGVVVVEEGGRVVLSSPVAEKWLAQELRTGEQPIQRFLESLHDEWAENEINVTLGDHDLKLMAFELPAEDEKPRKVVMMRSVEWDEAEIGEKLLEPVQDLKRGLSKLYTIASDDQETALLRHLAAQVSQLEDLQRSLGTSNGHLAPAVLPPSWRDKKARDENLDERAGSLEDDEGPPAIDPGTLEARTPLPQEVDQAMRPPDAKVSPPEATVGGEAHEVEARTESQAGVEPLGDDAVISETGNLLQGSVVLYDESEEEQEVSTGIALGAEEAEQAQAEDDLGESLEANSQVEESEGSGGHKPLWEKAKERGWTARLDKESAIKADPASPEVSPRKDSAKKSAVDLGSSTVPSEGRVGLDAPTIPHIKPSDADSQDMPSSAVEGGGAKSAPENTALSQGQGDKKNMDDAEALEAFSVSLLEFEPKTQIHRRSEDKPQMGWPPPPPSQYNPEDYEELRG